jgi:hypothetical protein
MKNILKAILVAAAVISAGSLYAVPTLTIFDGTTTITVLDNGSGDRDARLGVVSWSGTIGVWNLSLGGLTQPFQGNATQVDMDLRLLNATSNSTPGSHTLTLTWSDNGYTVAGLARHFVSGSTAGTEVDSVRENSTNMITQGPFGPGGISGTVYAPITLTPSDGISLVVVLTHNGAGTTSGYKELTLPCNVPDGGSAVGLLSIAVVGLEALRRRLRLV